MARDWRMINVLMANKHEPPWAQEASSRCAAANAPAPVGGDGTLQRAGCGTQQLAGTERGGRAKLWWHQCRSTDSTGRI